MNCWIAFFLGSILGGFIGVVAMCIFSVSGEESRREIRRNFDEW